MRLRRTALSRSFIALALALAWGPACASPQRPPRAAPPVAPSAPALAAPRWRVSPHTLRTIPPRAVDRRPDDTLLVLADSVRLELRPDGAIAQASDRPASPIVYVASDPARGRWVFVDELGAVFASDSFLGALRRVGELGHLVERPRSGVLRMLPLAIPAREAGDASLHSAGALWLLDGVSPPQRIFPSRGLAVRGAEFLDATHGLAVLETGALVHTLDGGASWARVDGAVGAHSLVVRAEQGDAWIASGLEWRFVVTREGLAREATAGDRAAPPPEPPSPDDVNRLTVAADPSRASEFATPHSARFDDGSFVDIEERLVRWTSVDGVASAWTPELEAGRWSLVRPVHGGRWGPRLLVQTHAGYPYPERFWVLERDANGVVRATPQAAPPEHIALEREEVAFDDAGESLVTIASRGSYGFWRFDRGPNAWTLVRSPAPIVGLGALRDGVLFVRYDHSRAWVDARTGAALEPARAPRERLERGYFASDGARVSFVVHPDDTSSSTWLHVTPAGGGRTTRAPLPRGHEDALMRNVRDGFVSLGGARLLETHDAGAHWTPVVPAVDGDPASLEVQLAARDSVPLSCDARECRAGRLSLSLTPAPEPDPTHGAAPRREPTVYAPRGPVTHVDPVEFAPPLPEGRATIQCVRAGPVVPVSPPGTGGVPFAGPAFAARLELRRTADAGLRIALPWRHRTDPPRGTGVTETALPRPLENPVHAAVTGALPNEVLAESDGHALARLCSYDGYSLFDEVNGCPRLWAPSRGAPRFVAALADDLRGGRVYTERAFEGAEGTLVLSTSSATQWTSSREVRFELSTRVVLLDAQGEARYRRDFAGAFDVYEEGPQGARLGRSNSEGRVRWITLPDGAYDGESELASGAPPACAPGSTGGDGARARWRFGFASVRVDVGGGRELELGRQRVSALDRVEGDGRACSLAARTDALASTGRTVSLRPRRDGAWEGTVAYDPRFEASLRALRRTFDEDDHPRVRPPRFGPVRVPVRCELTTP